MGTTDWTRRTQAATQATATRNREGWTSAELELVDAFGSEVTDAELARTLGRTLFAIQTIKHAIAAGKQVGSTRRVASSDRPYRGWTEDMGSG